MRVHYPLLLLALAWPSTALAAESYESVEKGSVPVTTIGRVLLPFVATCENEKDHFRHLFCSALNERLKAQHQAKTYRSTFEASEAGPLQVHFKAKPKPQVEVTVMGCLTCAEPMVERAGGDVSKGRFFVFKTPKDITIRRGKALYDFGDISLATYQLDLPAGTTEKKFEEEIRPFLRLDFVYRPVAGVTMVGGRYKYGVIQFEQLGHRVYDRCGGTVVGAGPAMAGKILVDKHDMTCPQNQPKKVEAKPVLPVGLPKVAVKTLMERLGDDLHTCYEQHGEQGDTPVELIVSADGKVKSARVTGKLAGTATGQCVERLVREAAFPKFVGDDARLQWPLAVRN